MSQCFVKNPYGGDFNNIIRNNVKNKNDNDNNNNTNSDNNSSNNNNDNDNNNKIIIIVLIMTFIAAIFVVFTIIEKQEVGYTL